MAHYTLNGSLSICACSQLSARNFRQLSLSSRDTEFSDLHEPDPFSKADLTNYRRTKYRGQIKLTLTMAWWFHRDTSGLLAKPLTIQSSRHSVSPCFSVYSALSLVIGRLASVQRETAGRYASIGYPTLFYPPVLSIAQLHACSCRPISFLPRCLSTGKLVGRPVWPAGGVCMCSPVCGLETTSSQDC